MRESDPRESYKWDGSLPKAVGNTEQICSPSGFARRLSESVFGHLHIDTKTRTVCAVP